MFLLAPLIISPLQIQCTVPLGVNKPERGEVVRSPKVKVTYSRKEANASQLDVYRARAAEERSGQTRSFVRVVTAP